MATDITLDQLQNAVTRIEHKLDALTDLVLPQAKQVPEESIIAQREDGAVRLANVEAYINSQPASLQNRLAVGADGNRWFYVFDSGAHSPEAAFKIDRACNTAMFGLIILGSKEFAFKAVWEASPAGTYAFAGPNGTMFPGVGMNQAVDVIKGKFAQMAIDAGGPTYEDFVKANYKG